MPAIESTRSGKGFPIIFIHGFCETSAMWYPYVESLTDTYEIICPDLPGFGKSELITDNLSLEKVADALAKQLQSEGVQNAVFIGHSLGGYVALALAQRHPQMIRGLGLFHSHALGDTDEDKHKREKALLFLEKHSVSKFIRPFIPSLFYQPRWDELRHAIERSTEIGLTTPLATILAYTEAMRDRKNRFQVWCDIPVRTLFIGATHDSRIPVEVCEQHIEEKDFVDGYILPETAHMGMFERPSETLLMIRDYLLKVV